MSVTSKMPVLLPPLQPPPLKNAAATSPQSYTLSLLLPALPPLTIDASEVQQFWQCRPGAVVAEIDAGAAVHSSL
jgi:hypothetical protein